MNSDDGRIPTNLRTLLILEAVARSDAALTATEINAGLGLPKQTIHRLCTTLEAEGFLVRDGTSRRYLASRRTRDMAAGLLAGSRHHIARRQILEQVAREVGETVNYVVPRERGMSYLDRVETDWAFRVQLPIGSHVPFHCTASGKTYLASLPGPARGRLVAALPLDARTPHTHTSPAALLGELSEIRRQGYALDCEEFIEGMVAIAVPVTDPQGRFAAALAFHGPTQRLDHATLTDRLPLLREAAGRLQNALFSED